MAQTNIGIGNKEVPVFAGKVIEWNNHRRYGFIQAYIPHPQSGNYLGVDYIVFAHASNLVSLFHPRAYLCADELVHFDIKPNDEYDEATSICGIRGAPLKCDTHAVNPRHLLRLNNGLFPSVPYHDNMYPPKNNNQPQFVAFVVNRDNNDCILDVFGERNSNKNQVIATHVRAYDCPADIGDVVLCDADGNGNAINVQYPF